MKKISNTIYLILIIVISSTILFSCGSERTSINKKEASQETKTEKTETTHDNDVQKEHYDSWIASYDVITIGNHQYILFKDKTEPAYRHGVSIFVIHSYDCPNPIHKSSIERIME